MVNSLTVLTSDGVIDISVDDARLQQCEGDVRNHYVVRDFIIAWIALLSDSPLNTSSLKSRRLFRHFLSEVTSRPVKETIIWYSDLCDTLMANCHSSGEGSSTGPFLEDFKDTPVFREYHSWYKSRSPELLTWLLSFLRFGKKLHYYDPEFESTAFRKWVEIEEQMENPINVDYSCLKDILALIFNDRTTTYPFLGRHGTGAVADGHKGRIEKTRNFTVSPKLRYAFQRKVQFLHFSDMDDQKVIFPDDPDSLRNSIEYSKLLFVPKNVKTARSICMEPTPYMYFQQHYAAVLTHMINTSYLSNIVTIHDQTPNQIWSEYGSWSGNVDTIDLSSASDSVRLDVVKDIFPKHILFFLLATRTSKVLTPDSRIRSVKKYAPMGSALCFPVQCIIYSAIVVQASLAYLYNKDIWYRFSPGEIANYLRSVGRLGTYQVSPIRLEPPRVYGDDIICDSRVTENVLHVLRSLGFSPNDSKSFRGSQSFRESCGKFYWEGCDVTPVSFNMKSYEGPRSASNVASLISLANTAGDMRLCNLRRYYIQRLLYDRLEGVEKYQGKNPILFSDDKDSSFSIFTTTPRNCLKTRYNIDYQRDEVKSIGVKPLSSVKDLSYVLDRYQYLQWWRTRWVSDFGPEKGQTPIDSFHSKLCWRWTPSRE